MKEHNFALVINNESPPTKEFFLKLSESVGELGCDDATVKQKDSSIIIEFNREAESYEVALASAVLDLSKIQGIIINNLNSGQYNSLCFTAEEPPITEISK